jgi:hypothetical protein
MICAKSGYDWFSGSEEINILQKDEQTDGQRRHTTGIVKAKLITLVFSSGEL